jgi:curved DNA-binding protein CbpA
MEPSAFTCYDLLGVLPGASTQQISDAYTSKMSLLQPARLAGAPSQVIGAASRARQMLYWAWRALGDPASRLSYDESTGIRRVGDGLVRADNYASQPAMGDVGFVAGSQGAEALGILMALTDWLAPHPHPARHAPGR